ncbi:MAG TPA: 50S ribosomal protein L21 [Candidatus Merdivicinus excrementipullorum]|uniref:Large ribosomal subunit protein bL21 n=1 Tax=Candidatus Merdivicinus excrementipullorum TaxID=2840867 RepID=A0A9D1FNG1_9FIRM|nr:50S ribosomal protein L21 [Candidatus Merdivicinus excrementipullorum]HIV19143.1 50S ribosomal protein L21 [Candidatus Merdivicinus intestinigallinarum]
MFAIIETGGKQYRVQAGDVIFIEKIEGEAQSNVTFDKVSLVADENGTKIGAPYVDGASVSATLLKTGKGKKITVWTYRPKKGSQRKMGHRQLYSQVRIDAINA